MAFQEGMKKRSLTRELRKHLCRGNYSGSDGPSTHQVKENARTKQKKIKGLPIDFEVEEEGSTTRAMER